MEFVRRRTQVFNESPSMTQQEFREECNIKNIVRKALKTGLPPPTKKGFFGDFVGVDFTSMQNTMAQASEAFNSLHPAIRRKFHNNPAELIEFIEDNQNYEEAVKMGLIPMPEKPQRTLSEQNQAAEAANTAT